MHSFANYINIQLQCFTIQFILENYKFIHHLVDKLRKLSHFIVSELYISFGLAFPLNSHVVTSSSSNPSRSRANLRGKSRLSSPNFSSFLTKDLFFHSPLESKFNSAMILHYYCMKVTRLKIYVHFKTEIIVLKFIMFTHFTVCFFHVLSRPIMYWHILAQIDTTLHIL